LGQILDTVVRSGANSIYGIQFDVQDKDKAVSQARKLAVDDAKKQADELTQAAGVTLGQIITMSVYMNNTPMPAYDKGIGGTMAAQAPNVPVSAGQLILSMDAQITYELK
jgi:uncharacterized protein